MTSSVQQPHTKARPLPIPAQTHTSWLLDKTATIAVVPLSVSSMSRLSCRDSFTALNVSCMHLSNTLLFPAFCMPLIKPSGICATQHAMGKPQTVSPTATNFRNWLTQDQKTRRREADLAEAIFFRRVYAHLPLCEFSAEVAQVPVAVKHCKHGLSIHSETFSHGRK